MALESLCFVLMLTQTQSKVSLKGGSYVLEIQFYSLRLGCALSSQNEHRYRTTRPRLRFRVPPGTACAALNPGCREGQPPYPRHTTAAFFLVLSLVSQLTGPVRAVIAEACSLGQRGRQKTTQMQDEGMGQKSTPLLLPLRRHLRESRTS